MFVLFSKYVRAVNVMKSGWQVRWTRSMGQARNVHVWSQNLKRRNYWVDLGLDNRIILKCILDKCGSGWTRYCNLAFHKRRALDRQRRASAPQFSYSCVGVSWSQCDGASSWCSGQLSVGSLLPITHPPPSQPSPAAITNPDYTVFYLAPGGGEGMALGDLPTPTPSTV